MVIMATTARERLSQLLLLKLMLNQDIIIMVTLMVMAMDTATMDTMARGMLMLSPGIIITVTDTLMVDTAITVTMARGRQRLLLDTIIMDILMVMVAMDTTVTMERGRLMLSQDTITMVMAMGMADMDTMVTMARERLSQDIIIMVTVMVDMAIMVMDIAVNKQHLFISFQNSVTYIGTCWNLVKRNTHLKNIHKSLSKIKLN